MKRQTLSAMVMAVVTSGSLCYWSEVAFAGPEDGDHAALVAGNTEFALDLYAHLRAADGNLFLSPFSVSTALAMTYGGARGPTATQMAQTLHFDLPQERLHPAFAALADLWDRGDEQVPYQLSVANALWVQQGLSLLETFTELNRVHHGAGLRELDFQGATEQTRRTIIDGKRGLFISNVVHKAFVGVDEEGTEAAAATGVVMKRVSVPLVFRADRPFVFMIRHNATGSILFMGRVVNPTAQ